MSEKLCPFGDGRHKKKLWIEKDESGRRVKARARSGQSCILCHKTWESVGVSKVPTLIPTWFHLGLEDD